MPDGHVVTVDDKYVVASFNLPPTGVVEGILSGNVPTGLLTPFDDALDILETEADGRNPNNGKKSAMALPGYSASSPAAPLYNRETFYPNQIVSGGTYVGPTNWTY
jgi:hypothetical protein